AERTPEAPERGLEHRARDRAREHRPAHRARTRGSVFDERMDGMRQEQQRLQPRGRDVAIEEARAGGARELREHQPLVQAADLADLIPRAREELLLLVADDLRAETR